LVVETGGPDVPEELGHGVEGAVHHAGDGPHAHALNEGAEDLDALGRGKPVHAPQDSGACIDEQANFSVSAGSEACFTVRAGPYELPVKGFPEEVQILRPAAALRPLLRHWSGRLRRFVLRRLLARPRPRWLPHRPPPRSGIARYP